ncbi:hypothetical protein Fot_24506 [Forsythia ovata]|uniref:Uncharacterized protein n=1 Tax=Forsythia ovata TaxID=205694 RepID=A0ABD1U745_9LAMI
MHTTAEIFAKEAEVYPKAIGVCNYLQPDFMPDLAVQTSGELILSALGNSTNAANPILIDDSLNWKHLQRVKNVVEEEHLDADNFFNDNPDDISTLPCSSPARNKTEQKDKFYS